MNPEQLRSALESLGFYIISFTVDHNSYSGTTYEIRMRPPAPRLGNSMESIVQFNMTANNFISDEIRRIADSMIPIPPNYMSVEFADRETPARIAESLGSDENTPEYDFPNSKSEPETKKHKKRNITDVLDE